MRTNFETQTIGLATELDESLFNTMNNNDKYMRDRLDVAGGKLLIHKEFPDSERIPAVTPVNGDIDRLDIYESEFDYEVGRRYMYKFQSRSITCETGADFPAIIYYIGYPASEGTLIYETSWADGIRYTGGLSYGPLNLMYGIYLDPASFPSYEIGDKITTKLYFAVSMIEYLGGDGFPINIDSSEGAKAYFAFYDMGVAEDV